MEKFKLILLLLLASVMLQAQTNNERFAANLMQWLYNREHSPEKNRMAVKFKTNNIEYLSAFIKVSNAIDETLLKKIGVVVGTKAGNIWTVSIPIDNMVAFTKLGYIEYIELDHFVKVLMDSARYVTGVDSVHQGINIPLPLSGKGVVVGVVDIGFDYANPSFYDTTYTNLRVKRVWDQSTNGTPPKGFNYGSELTDTNSMLLQKNSSTTEDHGMCTSSIAGGSGYGSKNNNKYRGVAYDCDFVLVQEGFDYLEIRGMSITRLIDAFNYIFTYAQSVGKPAVINVSIGSWTGPHDGSSLFSQACDNLCGSGKVVVFGAGNDGSSKIHLQKTFTNGDSITSTLVTMPYKENYFEIWGDTGKTFEMEIGLFSKGVLGAKTQRFNIDKKVHSLFLIGSDKDTSFITITSNINLLNNKPVVTAEIIHKTNDSLYVSVLGQSGTIHVWDEQWGDFIGNGKWAIDGDSRYSIGEMGCTKSGITVSAFASKMTWKNLQNQSLSVDPIFATAKGKLALFSSKGPTTDGRMKPDITAPGCMIATATNSYSPTFRPGGTYYFLSESKFISTQNNRTYYFSLNQGTSLSAPMVTGIVALLFQVNPSLSPEDIKGLLYKTAIKDSFTTQNPNPGLWGAGKINAYSAVKEAILTSGVISIPNNENEITVYPNPVSDKFTVAYESEKDGNFLVEITNLSGQLVQTKLWQISVGNNQLQVQLDSQTKGVYFISITGNGGTVTKKIVLQ